MLYAVDRYSNRLTAAPKTEGYCPMCEESLIPKCGTIVCWHWAHHARFDCDPWSEPESEWHLYWKNRALPAQCEVQIGNHRADIVGRKNTVIELQHSSISPDEIAEREEHYDNMIWLIDASPFIDNLSLRQKTSKWGREYWTFRWKHPRMSLFAIEKPQYWDLGPDCVEVDGILHVKELHEPPNASGWGYIVDEDRWAERWIGGRHEVQKHLL